MNVKEIRKLIFPAVLEIVSKLEEKDEKIKITILRSIFNEAINSSLNISHHDDTNIKSMFSGRGRAWAKVKVDNNNPAWISILNTLNHEMTSSNTNSKIFKECNNILDLFENIGFAWIRFGSSLKGFSKFHIRIKGSKLEDHIKVRIDNSYILNNHVINLEGVPHRLGLESGNFENENFVKEIINVPVNTKELNNLGIMKLDDIINE